MSKRKTFGLVLIVFGILMVAASLSLVIWNELESRRAAEASEELLPFLEETIEQAKNENPPFPEDTSPDMKVVEIDGYGYIGYLSIPSLDLRLPVMDRWDYVRLKIAPCRYYGSVKTNDLIIAAHNYSRHFGRLSDLSAGDPVYFTDMDGRTYEYTVGTLEVLNPMDVQPMIESDWDLTMYSCLYNGRQRVAVRCRRKS